jgi:ribosome-associated toxin RatA of RatAB toxin-antitoxin module
MYGLVAGQVFEKTASMVMQAFEKRAQEVYGR